MRIDIGTARAGLALAYGAAGLAMAAKLAAAAPSAPPAEIAWAFPPAAAPRAPPSQTRIERLPGVAVTHTEAEIYDQFKMVDWRPVGRPPIPAVVREGRKPDVRACGYCHLPDGSGRPENAALAGLPADYIVRQLVDMHSGARQSVGVDWGPAALMRTTAAAMGPAEMIAAARYFAAIRFRPHTRVIEAAATPKATPTDRVYGLATSGPRQPLGQRIVEGPENLQRFELRDDALRYVAYAPPGSIAAGARRAATGGGEQTQVCASCHGAGLKGGAGPPLAGRSPTGLFRQLYAFKTGARNGALAAPMRAVAAKLTTPDMIALAAYAGSLRP
jgi:cytochrome c553